MSESNSITKKHDLSDETSRCDSLPRKKKQKTNGATGCLSHPAEINEKYTKKSFKDCIKTAFQDGIEATHIGTDAAMINSPFTCCVLPNFVKDEGFLKGLKEELLELDFNSKSNDLYKFQQSDALQNFDSPYITALKKLLYEDFLGWLREVTGIPFVNTFDLTCSKYNYTDVLLCHDDELEGRRVAFILYLVPEWRKKDGGLLDLFDMDEHGQPKSVVKSLVPKWNNFVFFEVTPKSFHQVSEVLNPDKCRLSVSGWFHGPTVPRPAPFVEPRCILTPHVDTQESLFYDWINESYLDLGNQSEVQDTFSDESEIQLSRFFEKDKYDAVLSELQNPDIRWKHRGPANKRHYETANLATLPPVIQECLSVMQSEHMFLLLSNFTALRLHSQAPCSDDEDGDDNDDIDEEKRMEETVDDCEKKVNGADERLGSMEQSREPERTPDEVDQREEDLKKQEEQPNEVLDGDICEENSSQKNDTGERLGSKEQSKELGRTSEEDADKREEEQLNEVLDGDASEESSSQKNDTDERLGSKEQSKELGRTSEEDADKQEELNKQEEQLNEVLDGDASEESSSQKDDADIQDGVDVKLKREPSTPRCRAELRRWTPGCYTLLHDTDTEGSEFALDASVFFNTQGVSSATGGFISYIAKGEDEELLSVLPEDNSLSLVYRDKETLRFVKHINHSFATSRGSEDNPQSSHCAFYELYLVYYE